MKNKNNISDIKQKLPQHSAPNSIWETIDEQLLSKNKSEQKLKSTISEMPNYSAPDKIWTVIDRNLHGKSIILYKIFKPNMLFKIAAVFIIILSINLILNNKSKFDNKISNSITENTQKKTQPKNKNIAKPKAIIEKPKVIESKKIKHQKQKRITKNKISEQQAIERTGLAIIPSIGVSNIIDKNKKSDAKLPKIKEQKISKIKKQVKFKKIKLVAHNEKAKVKKPKRSFSLGFFRPIKNIKLETDTANQNTKTLFAASINL